VFHDINSQSRGDVNLGAGGGTQAEQTAAIMIGYEKLLMEENQTFAWWWEMLPQLWLVLLQHKNAH